MSGKLGQGGLGSSKRYTLGPQRMVALGGPDVILSQNIEESSMDDIDQDTTHEKEESDDADFVEEKCLGLGVDRQGEACEAGWRLENGDREGILENIRAEAEREPVAGSSRAEKGYKEAVGDGANALAPNQLAACKQEGACMEASGSTPGVESQQGSYADIRKAEGERCTEEDFQAEAMFRHILSLMGEDKVLQAHTLERVSLVSMISQIMTLH